ncbi:MAG: hypothetical protein R3E02_10005 [Blastomonas sp.]
MSDIETRSPDQLPVNVTADPLLRVLIQMPDGTLQTLNWEALLGRLLVTDLVFETRAGLYADLDHDEHSVALVYADATAGQSGWYRKVGASGAGNWSQFEKLSSEALAEVQAAIDDADALLDSAVADAESARDDAEDAAAAVLASVALAQGHRDAAEAARDVSTAKAAEAGVYADASEGTYQNLLDALDGETLTSPIAIAVANLAALQAITEYQAGTLCYMTLTGRAGLFEFVTGDKSAEVTSDPDKGIWVAPGSDLTGASGAWRRVVAGRTYFASWWGVEVGTVDPQEIINRALAVHVPEYSKFILPAHKLLLSIAEPGSVKAGSSNVNSGVIGAIYIDKDGMEIEGYHLATDLDGQGAALNCIMVRGSHCRVRRISGGNIAGQLTTNESAVVCFQPSNFTQGNGSGEGADISDLIVEDIHCYDADTAVTATAEIDLVEKLMFVPKKLRVHNITMEGIRRQGVEIAACDESEVLASTYHGGDKGAYVLSRFVRIIGSRKVRVFGNRATGFDQNSTGYIGVQVETVGYYGNQNFYEICADIKVTHNQFDKFGCHVQIDDAQSEVEVASNIIKNEFDGNAHYALRVLSTGIRNPGYGAAVDEDENTYETEDFAPDTGTPIQSLFTRHGLDFGVTYYAIKVDDNTFKWATSEANAIAGTAIDLTEDGNVGIWLTVEDMTGIDNKLVTENVNYHDNTVIGPSHVLLCQGRTLDLKMQSNRAFLNASSSTGCVISMAGTHAHENVVIGKLKDNEIHINRTTSSAPISIDGLKADALITVDDNGLTPSTGGAFISHSGPGTVIARNANSNYRIDPQLWDDHFSPPKGRLQTESA